MKHIITTALLFSSTAFASEYTLGLSYNTITNSPLGYKKGSFASGNNITASIKEDEGRKFYNIPTRHTLNIGYMDFKMGQATFQALHIGYDKELYYNIKKVQLQAFAGIGYKFVDGEGTNNHTDAMLPSKVYARLGFGAFYQFTSKLKAGVLFTHFSNGDLTPRNFGHDFYGVGINWKL